MLRSFFRLFWWWLVALVLGLAGAALIARQALQTAREAFETDARIMHRVLSQRVVQHDAMLATVSLLQAEQGAERERRLASVYPQVLAIQRRQGEEQWSDARVTRAETASRELRRPELAMADFNRGRYVLVLAGEPASHAMTIGLREMLPWDEWPTDPRSSPVQVLLQFESQSLVLQPGQAGRRGWHFDFSKRLAADSQPFDLHAMRVMGWEELPWVWMGVWCGGVLLLVFGLYQLRRQRSERRRAEELLRLGQVARLNTLGELAAGMAHELNQPLTAVLANTQAARRVLAETPPDLELARGAMHQAVEQARRASEVVGRLRQAVERPKTGASVEAFDLLEATRKVLYLLEPECRRVRLQLTVEGAPGCRVLAEPVALEQIIHNLVMNALQALERVPVEQRRLHLRVAAEGARGQLRVADSGLGIPPEVLPRIFEPFFTTREGGLGLGLSLCETLAAGMGGELQASNGSPGGAVFVLSLPLAQEGA